VNPKRISQSIVAIAVLAASFASTGRVMAGSDCAGTYTVQAGDSLASIAAECGTTAGAIQAANPGVPWWPAPGQVLSISTGYGRDYGYGPSYYPPQSGGGTYVVRWGDTLGKIANAHGVALNALLAVNPHIWNPNYIFPGQVIKLPGAYAAAPSYYYGPGYASDYYAPTTYQPDYCTYDCYPSTSSSSIIWPKYSPAEGWRGLKVTYKYGLTVRTAPSRSSGEIAGLYVSAVKGSTWTYQKSSVTVDREGFVWVRVALPRVVDGYETGWIVVKDGLGDYYVSPEINP
jgi:LysM repeat protein